MSWDEQFASRYDEWPAGMTEDVPFYVSLARDADGPLVRGPSLTLVPIDSSTHVASP